MSTNRTPGSDLEQTVAAVVAAVGPLRVLLFGSVARGDDHAASDLDLMVVVPDGTRRLDTLKRLYGLGLSGVDFVVTTPEIYERRRRDANFVHFDVDRDGHELYAA